MTNKELCGILNELRTQVGETEIVEFKEAKSTFDFSKLGKYFSALSNEANLKNCACAWLIFGVEDKGHRIVGTQYRPVRKDLDSLKVEIANKINNRLTFVEIYELQQPDGRVIMFQIPSAPKGLPIAFEGLFYGRDGESLVGLNIQKIETIRMQIKHHDWSADVVEGADISVLDPEAVALAKELYISKYAEKREEIEGWSDADFLNKAKITRRGKITNAAIILLGKEESEELLSPAIAKIRWVLKGADGIERDYFIAGCPFLKSARTIYNKIRNLKYRYINPEHMTLFPEEIDTYEPYVIREALNNAIAHQDYSLGGRINVIEYEDKLVFTNKGSFIPGNIDNVICNNAPEEVYRNDFLVQAMVGIKMVDTIGSGIRKMFIYQQKRLFPLPDYEFNDNRVSVTIMGKIMDMNYANILVRNADLTIEDVWLLNKVQLKKDLNEDEILYLKKKKLVEGRRPNLFLAAAVAKKINKRTEYTKNAALDKQYYLDFIVKHIQIHGSSTRKEIDELLWNKLPDWMDENQKKNKIRNLLLELRTKKMITNSGTMKTPKWVLC